MRRALLTALAPLTLFAAMLAFALPALAEQPFSGDTISAHDQAEYSQGNFANRFHTNYRPHMRVCSNAVTGASCDARVTTDSAGTPQAATGPTGYGPAQLLKAYNLSGQSAAAVPPVIAIVDAYGDPNIQSDLNAYSSAFGIPTLPTCSGAVANSATACFQKVNQQGGTTYPATSAGWALETALDVEVARATCQNCSILLVEANSNSFYDLMSAVDRAVLLGATVVSNSYGASEFAGENVYDNHFNHPGVAFTFSAGDAGYGVEYPAASPYVTAVGGTSLFVNSDGSYNQELAWSGTGSGCSAFESKPTWQIDPGCLGGRTVADVSADADPNTGAAVYDSVSYGGQTGWFQVGGTSLASPLIAAVYAQGGVASGVQANSLPYTLGSTSNLHDVASGSNGVCGGSYLCTALLGYDGPTGLGSPNGIGAFSSSTPSSPIQTPPVPPTPPTPPAPTPAFSLSASPTSLSILRGNGGSDTITVNPSGGFTGSVKLSVSGVPFGVSAGFSRNPTSSSSSLRFSTSRRTPTGTYTLTIQGTSGSLASTTTLSLTIR